ncbi:Peptidyl-prolyl cis-trans isomerase-like 1 [Phytophthora pseudosyringae]|uniref:Peptidyl-prolyl cis-trans isomerase-like 1 n=1 Tax=Phytophthora pseudosyringae TaxID=221518 RepID=A0A8T1V6Z4_9STRA|nr:Peptidyl-prolyl cis-trans isomerase-like 1 [Phytophthora pseudosyringae]
MDAPGSSERGSVSETSSPSSNNVNHAVPEASIVELLHHTELVDPPSDAPKNSDAGDASRPRPPSGGNNEAEDTGNRKEAWIHVIEPVSDLQSSVFEFVPPPPTRGLPVAITATQDHSDGERPAATLEIKNRPKKRVSFAPEIEEGSSTLAHDHVLLIDASTERSSIVEVVEQSRRIERSYVVPDDIPPFGWWDCFQLGLSLTYTTMCLRRSISSRCLVFNGQQRQQTWRQTCITATQLSVLARAGLAFNTSTRSLIVRQGQPPPPPPKPTQKRPKRRRSRKSARLGFTRITARLRHRKRLSSKYKWAAKLSTRRTKAKNSTKPVKRRRPVRLKVKLKVKLKFKRGAKSNDSGDPSDDDTKVVTIKRTTKGPAKNKIGSYGAIAVFQALRVNRTLVSLCLAYAAIDDAAMSALAAALRVNTALTHLSLVGNRIGSAGARDLADALEDSPDSLLIDLDLRDNRLGAQGADELGRALRENETLTRCDLSWNQMGPQAVLGLLSALRDNFALRELCVYGRDLAEDGTHYLANLDFDSAKRIVVALRHVNDSFALARLSGMRALLPIDKMKTSRWISLADRELVELDGLVVAGLIPQNNMLLSLDLHDNPGLGRAAVLELLTAIKRSPTLRDVNLANTGLFPDAGESVGELVALNSTLETIKMHETVISVQRVCGNQRAGEVPETAEFSVDPKHFLDRWILAKCFAVNRLTQELNELRLPDGARSAKKTATIANVATNQKDHRALITVNLSGRPLELYEAAFLGKKMLHHLHLGRVALNSCMLDSAAARALADGVRNHATLHTLELENNPLGTIGGQALAECLASSNALTYLNLSWTQLGDDGVVGFREALMRNKSIERLDLRGNELRVRGVVAIAEGLRRTATLRELHLRWNAVSPAGAEALAVALEVNQSLLLLDIEHHTMGSRGATAFASMLERNKHLEQLNMGGTDSDDALDAGPGIGSEQTQRIAEALTNSNRSLRILHVGANRIDADAAARFGELLKFNKTLVALDLSRSGLDVKKAPRFFACLSANSTLERLNLAHNRIGNEGLVACTRALEINRTLRELNLAHNGMTEEPLAVLAAKLRAPKRQVTPTLEWLCLTGNNMTERTRREYLALPQNVIAIELQDKDELDEDADL